MLKLNNSDGMWRFRCWNLANLVECGSLRAEPKQNTAICGALGAEPPQPTSTKVEVFTPCGALGVKPKHLRVEL